MSELGDRLVAQLIRDYYSNADIASIAPDRISEREFGYGVIGNKIANRHMAFKTPAELKNFLVSNAPAFVDYSAAYYRFPDARPMEKKIWLGSELRFDLDASDAKYDCKIHAKGWLCDERLEAVKRDTLLLIEDFLIGDFGLSEKEIAINFSGNRGYHIHVTKDAVLQLSQEAREDLCNYIKPTSIPAKVLFPGLAKPMKRMPQVFPGPKPDEPGWRGKFALAFIEKLKSAESLMGLGIDEKLAKRLNKEKELVEMGIRQGNWSLVRMPPTEQYWQKVIDSILFERSVFIDANVTKDPSHLMRLPNTIHGGSGFIAKKIPSIADLEKFDPMKDAIAWRKGEAKIVANTPYALRIGDETYGPFSNAEAIVPIYAATYLYLKGFADIKSIY